ncbi:MAG: serine/threonine-protein kinase [Steroidobacter sp.]
MNPADEDKTRQRSAAEVEATMLRSATEVRTLVRTDEPDGETNDATAARTLKAGQPVHDSAFAPTLKSSPLVAEQGPSGPLEPGSVIKQRFLLEALLGKGGMGLVFSAIDRRKQEARDPNPHVALKVLNAEFGRHPQSFIALQREARKARTLAHPNGVTVFDFDRDGDTVYMTMELLKGRSLDSIVREARGKGNEPDFAMPIIRGVAEGLAYAHRKGIVHSDLKPGNVFIAADGTTKILDFGIARAVPSSVTEETRDEFDAGSLGAYTEAYATDEMVAGIDPHPADDMYALGIIAYELVTGFHPYQRHSAPNARKLGIKPAPLKGLKRKQARAIESCLSFERKNRPQDAAEFLKAFRGVTALQKATLAASAVLAVTAGYLWYQNYLETSPAIPFSELPAEVQQQFQQAIEDGDVAWGFYQNEGLAAGIDDALAEYSKAYEMHPRNREAVARLERAADEVLRLVGDDADKRRQVAADLQKHSDFFKKYAPIVAAAKD